MTLVALLALTTQAWATDVYVVGNGTGNWLNNAAWEPGAAGNKMTEQNGVYSITFTNVGANTELLFKFAINGTWDENFGSTSWDANELNKTLSNIEAYGNNIMFVLTEAADVTISFNLSELTYMISTNGMKVGDDTPVEWDAATKTGTFKMPASDVVLTPIYSAATVYDANQTEKMAYETLKEAFAKVQDGDVIKLDWNVTLTEDLATPTIEGGVKFTLDFNGYTIDGGTTYQIKHKNDGDQLTFTDSSNDQLGGLIAKGIGIVAGSKFVFDAGRYDFNGTIAEIMNGLCANTSSPMSLAEGKEFVDLEGGAAANDGFTLRVGFKTFELAIGAGKFATFYAEQNVKLDEATSGVNVYTVSGIDTDRSLAYVSTVSGVVAKETPILLYNDTDNELTAKLTATPDDATAVDVAPEFKGTAEAREFTADDMAAADYYVLSGGKAFAPVYEPGTLGKNKCWLEFAKQQIPSARQLTIVFDSEATGIRSMDNGQLIMDNWYDLNGRKLNAKPTRKGVYIKNGQKVVK